MIGKLTYHIVDFFRKTETVKVYNKIIKTQWLSKEELNQIQFETLKKLLLHSFNNVPYYTKLFNDYGFNPEKFNDFSDLKVLPLINKDVIRANFEKLKAKNFSYFLPRKTQTGGSTGKPLVTYKDKLAHSYIWANNLRGWNVAGYEIGDKFIQIASGSLLPNTTSIKSKLYSYMQNAILITSYHLTEDKIKEVIKIINSTKANYIYGYSSTISLIAQTAKNKNWGINRKLNGIFTTSDMLYPNQRKTIAEVFGSEVFDNYGCPEGGVITFECENHNGYHINQESAYVEIVNQNENGIGNIISTPLYSYAFPLIRYNTGDVGKIATDSCSCGRGLNKISELGGRIRDFIVMEDGRYIHGAFFNHLEALYNAKWISQYQIIQENINEITLKFSCLSEPVEDELKLIKNDLHKGLLPNIKINFDFSGVEYTKGGKFRLIISKVKNNWESI